MSSGSPVRKATLADVPRLAQALASAFQDDPVITWVLPDAQRRRVVLPVFMEFRLRKLAFPHDEIWMIQDGAASAAWVPPPGIWQMSLAQRVRLLLPMIGFLRLRTPTVLGGLGRMEACHPHEPPHWYLFIIGCERAAQGRGLGSGLLSDMLNRIDSGGFPAYLEFSNERNLDLYIRHGFRVTGEVAIPSGPTIWPMWREPRP